jgi:hypothetical protein
MIMFEPPPRNGAFFPTITPLEIHADVKPEKNDEAIGNDKTLLVYS